jgi:hypothetical protein
MNPTDEEIDLGLEDEIEVPENEIETPEVIVPPTKAELELRTEFDKLSARLNGRSDSDVKIDQLLELGRSFITNANAPKPDLAAERAQALEEDKAFGKMLEDMVLLKSPEEKAKFFRDSVSAIANTTVKAQVDAALSRYGAPLVDNAGKAAVKDFLAEQSDKMEHNPALYKAIGKHFVLNDNERNWVATAKATDRDAFLRARWKQAGGEALEESDTRRKTKASELSSKGGGGNVTQITLPGTKADQVALDRLANRMVADISDPKKREETKKRYIQNMMARLKEEGVA